MNELAIEHGSEKQASLLLERTWASTSLPIDPLQIASQLAIKVELESLEDGVLAAAVQSINGAAMIYINQDFSALYQRYGCALEIGALTYYWDSVPLDQRHDFTHVGRIFDFQVDPVQDLSNFDPFVDYELHRFAQALLMPRQQLEPMIDQKEAELNRTFSVPIFEAGQRIVEVVGSSSLFDEESNRRFE